MLKTAALFLLNRAMNILIGELWQFLQDTVKVYQLTTLSSNQKRDAVILDALEHCRNAGLAISVSLLNLGIEAAVQIVNGKARA